MPTVPGAAALDHLGFACRELAPLRRQFAALGFAPTAPAPLLARDPAGGVRALGQRSCHVVLGSTYLELTAVDAGHANHLEPWLARYEGLHIVAFRHADFDRWHAALPDAGAVQAAERYVGYGDRHGDARFRWFMLPATDPPEALACGVDNRNPGLVYQPAVQAHPNGALELTGVTLCAEDPAAAASRWADFTGAVQRRDGDAIVLELANGQLRLVSPAALEMPPPAVPALVGAEIRVASGAALAGVVAAGGGVARPIPRGLRVALAAPANAWLDFVAGSA